jgi:hypothetical protein
MTRAGGKILAGLEEALALSKLRGGPGFNFPCVHQTIVECANWDCQKNHRCKNDIGASNISPELDQAIQDELDHPPASILKED